MKLWIVDKRQYYIFKRCNKLLYFIIWYITIIILKKSFDSTSFRGLNRFNNLPNLSLNLGLYIFLSRFQSVPFRSDRSIIHKIKLFLTIIRVRQFLYIILSNQFISTIPLNNIIQLPIRSLFFHFFNQNSLLFSLFSFRNLRFFYNPLTSPTTPSI